MQARSKEFGEVGMGIQLLGGKNTSLRNIANKHQKALALKYLMIAQQFRLLFLRVFKNNKNKL